MKIEDLTPDFIRECARKTGLEPIRSDGYRPGSGCPLVIVAIAQGHNLNYGMKAGTEAAQALGLGRSYGAEFMNGVDQALPGLVLRDGDSEAYRQGHLVGMALFYPELNP